VKAIESMLARDLIEDPAAWLTKGNQRAPWNGVGRAAGFRRPAFEQL